MNLLIELGRDKQHAEGHGRYDCKQSCPFFLHHIFPLPDLLVEFNFSIL